MGRSCSDHDRADGRFLYPTTRFYQLERKTVIRDLAVLALACLCLLPSGAQADPQLPALFDVAGVAAGGALNIRERAIDGATIVGSLAHDRTGVEVVALSDGAKWGLVNFGERSGWVSMRHLSARPAPALLPNTFSCFGTEPFWHLSVKQDTSSILRTPQGDTTLQAGGLIGSANRIDRHYLPLGGTHGAVISHAACSDGMSDRDYALSVEVILADQPALLSGCCSIAP